MRRALLALALCCVCACQPDDRTDHVRAWLLARDPATNGYHVGVEDVEHLESLRELRGRDIELRRSTKLEDGILSGKGTTIDDGKPFGLEYSFDAEGAVVPGDQHSFHALTLYRNLDRVASLLRAHGHTPSRRLVVYYLPRYDNDVAGDLRLTLVDNAAYVSLARGFLIVPTFVLAELPMVLNEGVVAHEFGHSVVHQEMFGEAPQEPHADDGSGEWTAARQQLMAMHEGVADVIGFCATGDPDFIRPTADVDRDMSVPRSLTTNDISQMRAPPPPDAIFNTGDFDPHFQGSTLARTVYEMWKGEDGKVSAERRGQLLDRTLAALRSLEYTPEKFSISSFPNALVAGLPPGERKHQCAILTKRFEPLQGELTNCEGL